MQCKDGYVRTWLIWLNCDIGPLGTTAETEAAAGGGGGNRHEELVGLGRMVYIC